MARNHRLTVLVDGKIKDTLDTYASSMGLTTSALCAYVLGDFVRREERVLNPMMDAASQAFLQMAKEAMSPESEAALDSEKS